MASANLRRGAESPDERRSCVRPTRETGNITIGFNNFAHAVDHYVMLIFPTVVIGLEAVYGRPYDELLALGTASFFAFGLFSLPAGWLADRWSRALHDGGVLYRLRPQPCGRGLLAELHHAGAVAVRARRVRRDLSSGRHHDA